MLGQERHALASAVETIAAALYDRSAAYYVVDRSTMQVDGCVVVSSYAIHIVRT